MVIALTYNHISMHENCSRVSVHEYIGGHRRYRKQQIQSQFLPNTYSHPLLNLLLRTITPVNPLAYKNRL